MQVRFLRCSDEYFTLKAEKCVCHGIA